jgi:hypothetical protein
MFGFIDFQNLFFVENEDDLASSGKKKKKKFKYDLLFIDKNLQNIALE